VSVERTYRRTCIERTWTRWVASCSVSDKGNLPGFIQQRLPSLLVFDFAHAPSLLLNAPRKRQQIEENLDRSCTEKTSTLLPGSSHNARKTRKARARRGSTFNKNTRESTSAKWYTGAYRRFETKREFHRKHQQRMPRVAGISHGKSTPSGWLSNVSDTQP
jgi:hypothetical protein